MVCPLQTSDSHTVAVSKEWTLGNGWIEPTLVLSCLRGLPIWSMLSHREILLSMRLLVLSCQLPKLQWDVLDMLLLCAVGMPPLYAIAVWTGKNIVCGMPLIVNDIG